jgi:hypothetical protein
MHEYILKSMECTQVSKFTKYKFQGLDS